MERKLAEISIFEALDYCSKHFCSECPKSALCAEIFGSNFLSDEILKLALKCIKFNERL